MPIKVGSALFAIGIIIGIAFSAPVPKWEVATGATTELLADVTQQGSVVLVQPFTGENTARAAEWTTRMTQTIASTGATAKKAGPDVVGDAGQTHVLTGQLDKAGETLSMRLTNRAGKPVGATAVLTQTDWPTTLPPWAVGSLLAAIGIALWRRGVRLAAEADAGAEEDSDNPFVLLAQLIEPAHKLKGEISGLDENGVCERVDELLEGYVLPFAQVRQKVLDRLGMKTGSEILVVLAYGERMLNRVWSAASDGHLPEANACYPDAVAALDEAQRLSVAAVGAMSGRDGASTGGGSGAPVAAPDNG
jgi:hypothetical protein